MKRPRPAPPAEPDDAELFPRAMRDVTPVRPHNRALPRVAPPPPVPVKRMEDERLVLEELHRFAHAARQQLGAERRPRAQGGSLDRGRITHDNI